MAKPNKERDRKDLDELLSDARARIQLSINRARELEKTIVKMILKKLHAKYDDYRYCIGNQCPNDDSGSFSPLTNLYELYPQICVRFMVRPEIVSYFFPKNSISLFDTNTVIRSRLVSFFRDLVDEYDNDDIAMVFTMGRNKMAIMNEVCRAEDKIRSHNGKRCELIIYDGEHKHIIRKLDDIISAVITEEIRNASN